MKSLKKLVAAVLSATLLLACLCVQASAVGGKPAVVNNPARYTDIEGHWAQKSLSSVLSAGIMTGTSTTAVTPDREITRAEMATMMVRALEPAETVSLSAFTDVDPTAWYYGYLQKAVAFGILQGDGNGHIRPNDFISREEAAMVLYNCFDLYGYSANLFTYEDYDSVSSWAEDAVSACVAIGAINPTADKLNPRSNVSRAEFSAMMYSIVQDYESSLVSTYSDTVEGSLILTDGEVTLSGVTIQGNLYIGPGVGDEAVKLIDTYVNGKCYLLAGGGIELVDGSEVNDLVICADSADMTISTDGKSQIYNTVVTATNSGISLSGNLGTLDIESRTADVSISRAYIHEFKEGVSTKVVVDKSTVIDEMNYTGSPTAEDGEEYSPYVELEIAGANPVVGRVQVTEYNPLKLWDSYELTTEDLVTGLVYYNTTAVNTITIGGTIKYTKLGESSAYAGYYVPIRLLVLDEAGDFSVTVNNTKFTNLETVSTGEGIRLNLLVPFSSSQRSATIKLIPESGSGLSTVTITLRLDSTVKFVR